MIDSQSVKTTALAESRGFDKYKRVKEHKRHMVADAMGIPLPVQVTDANDSDSQTAYELLSAVFFWWNNIQKLWADGGYGAISVYG